MPKYGCSCEGLGPGCGLGCICKGDLEKVVALCGIKTTRPVALHVNCKTKLVYKTFKVNYKADVLPK